MTQPPEASLLVACLCAEWCGVCRDYRSVFEQVRARFPQAHFVWVDVEDQADVVDPLEVDNFPMLLIAVGNEARFFGSMTPQAGTLERLVRDRVADSAPLSNQSEATALVAQLKHDVIDLMVAHGAAHLQIGKTYPYLQGRNAASVALLRAIKAELDPHDILNPGALGL